MQTLVITGVSSGIGLETAKNAVGRGAWVFGSVRTGDDAVRVGRELGHGFTPLIFDVRDEAAVNAEAERLSEILDGQTLSGLVNNAGVAIPGPMLAQPIDELREVLDTNLLGTVLVTRAFAPLLGADRAMQGPPGRIVNMTSIAGILGQPFLSGYVASKHGVEGLSDTLRRELQVFGIDVVVVGPAPVRTPIWDKAEHYKGRYVGTAWGEAFDRGVTTLVEAGRHHSLEPQAIAELVWEALTIKSPKPRYSPAQHPILEQGLARILPRPLLDKLFGGFLGLRKAS
jgi:NAD(P)-dependent dehydrogenase (short-subunit alcohol dehydrogenase family)